MKLATVLLFAAMVYATSVSQETQSTGANSTAVTNTQDEIKKLEETRNQAVLHGDVAVLDRLTSDDYTFITLKGEMRTKAEILKGFTSGSFHYESREISDLQ